MAVLVLSPSSWNPMARRSLARHIYLDTAPVLPGFTVLAAFMVIKRSAPEARSGRRLHGRRRSGG